MRGVRTSIDRRWQDAVDLFEAGQRAAGYEESTVQIRVRRIRTYVAGVQGGPWTLSWEAYRTHLDALPVSDVTRAGYRTALRAFYRWAVKTGRTDQDPTDEPSLRAEVLLAPPVWEAELAAYRRHLRALGRAEGTVAVRVAQVRRFARERSSLPPFGVTTDDLLDWLGGHRWEPETRHGHAAALRSFYGWAKLTKRVKRDPARKLPPVRMNAPLPRPAKESDYLEARAKANPWERLALQLARELGLRCAEVAAVHHRDVDGGEGDYWLTVHGKGRKDRRVPISGGIAHAIRAQGDGFAFPGQWDGHVSPQYLGKRINGLLPAGVTMHMLRHRFATLAYAVDRDVFTVQRLLGHSSPATTQRYVQVNDDVKRRLVDAVKVG